MILNRFEKREFRQLNSKNGDEYSLSSTLYKNDCFIHQEVLKPGKRSSAIHYHKDSDECIYILEGSCEALEGEKIVPLNKGDFIVFEKGSKLGHFLINKSNEDCSLLVIKKNVSDTEFC